MSPVLKNLGLSYILGRFKLSFEPEIALAKGQSEGFDLLDRKNEEVLRLK